MTTERPLLIITGPTASGKERLALAAAALRGGEIVSVDSMKIYRRLDIATAKASAADRAAVPHHCLDLAAPEEQFSAAEYAAAADAAIADIRARGRIPVLSGGTALYYKALLEGLFEGPGRDMELRRTLEELAAREGTERLHADLAAIDPAAAAKIHPGDLRRLVRAHEIHHLTGQPISARQTQWQAFAGPLRHAFVMFRITRSRPDLHERIRQRIAHMDAAGLRTEAQWVHDHRDTVSRTLLQAVGYKELFPFFEGQADWPAVLEKLALATNKLVRKQETWFRKFPAREIFLTPDAQTEQTAEELLRIYDSMI